MQPKILSWEQTSRYIYKNDTLFVDLREKSEYLAHHLTGAWNIPYEEIENHWDELMNYERVIFYCDRGNHSLAAAKELTKRGKEAFSLAGGYEGNYGTKKH